jgi:hypothetical protein
VAQASKQEIRSDPLIRTPNRSVAYLVDGRVKCPGAQLQIHLIGALEETEYEDPGLLGEGLDGCRRSSQRRNWVRESESHLGVDL